MDLHYENGPLTGHAPGASHDPANGHRAQDIALKGSPARLNEILHAGKFALLSVDAPAVLLPPELSAIATTAEADGHANYTPGHHYLIRPDGYVALSTGTGTAEPIIDYLRKIAAVIPRLSPRPPKGRAIAQLFPPSFPRKRESRASDEPLGPGFPLSRE